MAQITGRVFKVYTKEFPNKKPGAPSTKLHSIKLEDNPIYYRAERKTKFGDSERYAGIAEPGNMVTFDADVVNETSAQISGPVTIVEAPKAAASQATALVAQGSNGGGSYNDRDSSIRYQSARKDALEFVNLIVTAGAVKLPAKEALKLQALEALVDHYTSGFYADIETKGAVARAAGEDEPATEGPAKPAASDDTE